MKLILRHMSDDYDNRVRFAIFDRTDSDTRRVAKPLEFVESGYCAQGSETLSLPMEEAKAFLQSVMDVGWELGVRPTGYDNDLGATKHHLDDMRKIVFHKLGVPK